MEQQSFWLDAPNDEASMTQKLAKAKCILAKMQQRTARISENISGWACASPDTNSQSKDWKLSQ